MSEAGTRGRFVAVVGPTASGKTTLAIRIAEAAGAEIVSADSQAVYRGMDIGTAKATAEEQARVRHHLIDIAAPDEPMTAARFVEAADAAIADITRRGRRVVLAGGTGLYYRALVFGLFQGPAADPGLRARLEEEAARLGTEALWQRLAGIDPTAAGRIDRRDRIRTIRALEVFELTGVPISVHQQSHDYRKAPPRYQVLGVGLEPPRAELHAAIDRRVDAMLAAGLLDEVRQLEAAGYPCSLRAFQAIGYRQMCAHLHGAMTLEEATQAIKRATRRYGRRQLAWFRTEPDIRWYKSPSEVDVAGLAVWLRQ